MTRTLVFSAICWILFAACGFSQSETYKVYALRFKYAGVYSAKNAVVGSSPTDSVNVCYMICFLKGDKGHNILVDAGFLDSTAVNSKTYIRPDLILKDIGLTPADITDIIITHPHYDHINGISLFPQGKIWMQKKDFEYFAVDSWKTENKLSGFKPEDVRSLMEAALKGRLNLVDGDNIEILPGITVFTGSKHTMENQYLLVASDSGKKVLLASDAIWYYLNLNQLAPMEYYVIDPVAYVNAMKRMKTLVTGDRLIIPGHDNGVFLLFPKVSENVVIIR